MDIKRIHKDVIPAEQLEAISIDNLLTSIEPQHLVDIAYPKLVEDFKISKIKPNKQKVQKDPVKKRKTTKSNCEDKIEKQNRISTYLQKCQSNTSGNTNDDFKDLDQSNFGDENDLDLSDIVDNIINYNQPGYIKENLKKIQNDKLESSFFMKLSTDTDLFEQTFTNINCHSSSEESDS